MLLIWEGHCSMHYGINRTLLLVCWFWARKWFHTFTASLLWRWWGHIWARHQCRCRGQWWTGQIRQLSLLRGISWRPASSRQTPWTRCAYRHWREIPLYGFDLFPLFERARQRYSHVSPTQFFEHTLISRFPASEFCGNATFTGFSFTRLSYHGGIDAGDKNKCEYLKQSS